jgi:hypothetical protein
MNAPIRRPTLPAKVSTPSARTVPDMLRKVDALGNYLTTLSGYLEAYLSNVAYQINSQVQSYGAPIAAAASISPTNPIHHITGTGTISTIVVGPEFTGPLFLLADAAFSWTTGGNIALAGTATADTCVIFVYDGTEWFPVAGAGGGSGPGSTTFVTVTTTYSVAAGVEVVRANPSGGAFTVTLPAAAANSGRVIEVKNIDTTNSVTLDGNAAETIDGSPTQAISPLNALRVLCNGTSWDII